MTVLFGSVALVVAYHVAGYPAIGLVWPLLLPYLSAAAAGYLAYAVATAISLSAGAFVWRVFVEHDLALFVLVGEAQTLIVVGLALAVGEAAWQRRRWADEVRARLARATEEARLEREHALSEQRLAVARDLHDVIAHSLVVIGLQLRLAEETVEDDPDACRKALNAALTAHDEAVSEGRATLQLLRGAETDVSLSPAPGLADIDRLIDLAAASSVELTLDMDDDLAQPPVATGLIAFRIGKEALTNTLKHTNATAATIRIDRFHAMLRVRYEDNGTPTVEARTRHGTGRGFGLEGMRERVHAIGGTLDIDRNDDGSLRLDGRLPLTPDQTE